MINTHLNIFDAIVLSIMLLSCLFAFFRGFVREILSLGAWIGAAVVTIRFFPAVAEYLKPHFKSPIVAGGVATLGLYVVALIVFSMINMLILKYVKKGSDVGMLDNLLGLIFGALRGALIIALGFFLITIALPEKEYPDWIKQSVTRPYVEKAALMLANIAPNYLRDISSLEKKAMRASGTPVPQDNAQQEIEDKSDDAKGYSRESSEQMDKLLDSTGTAK